MVLLEYVPSRLPSALFALHIMALAGADGDEFAKITQTGL